MLGDLKLYRIPEPVTVAAHSQKQVSFLDQPNVQVRSVYRHRLYPSEDGDLDPARRFLITRNRGEEGLGIPLPAGRVQLFAAILALIVLEVNHLKWIWWTYWDCRRCGRKNADCGACGRTWLMYL